MIEKCLEEVEKCLKIVFFKVKSENVYKWWKMFINGRRNVMLLWIVGKIKKYVFKW